MNDKDFQTCPVCGAPLKAYALEWLVDEERYVIERRHYCSDCGWDEEDRYEYSFTGRNN